MIMVGTRRGAQGSEAYVKASGLPSVPNHVQTEFVHVCEQIASQYGGSLTITSDGEAGTVEFLLSLPAAA